MIRRIVFATILATAAFSGPYALQAYAADPAPAAAQDSPAAGTPQDHQLAARVKAALSKDKDLTGVNIAVSVNNGVVELTGVLKSRDLVERAAQIARSVPGVKDVKSDIRLS